MFSRGEYMGVEMGLGVFSLRERMGERFLWLLRRGRTGRVLKEGES